MSVNSVIAPKNASDNQAINVKPTCGMRLTTAVTVASSVLAGAVVLAEGTRFLDLQASVEPIADLFKTYLPSAQTNTLIAVGAITLIIGSRMLGSHFEGKQKARLDEEARVAKAEAERVQAENLAKRTELGKAIELYEKVGNRVDEVHRHPQAKLENAKQRELALTDIERKLIESAPFKSKFNVVLVPAEATKLGQVLKDIHRILEDVSKSDELMDALSCESIRGLVKLAGSIEEIIDLRLAYLSLRETIQNNNNVQDLGILAMIADFEGEYKDLINKVIVNDGKSLSLGDRVEKLTAVIAGVDEILLAAAVQTGVDTIDNNNNRDSDG